MPSWLHNHNDSTVKFNLMRYTSIVDLYEKENETFMFLDQAISSSHTK
jgi:hypothetical protein